MLIKKLLYLLIIFFTAVIFQECCKPAPRFFRRTNMHITHAAQNRLTISNQNLPTNEPVVIDTSQRYLLKADFDLEYLAKNNKSGIFNFFFTTVYASQPCPEAGEKGSKENITSITITSDADYDAEHPAGKSLNKFFRVSNNSTSFTDSLNANQIFNRWPDFQLDLVKKPVIDSVHKFIIHLELSNGISLTAKSPEAIFRNQ